MCSTNIKSVISWLNTMNQSVSDVCLCVRVHACTVYMIIMQSLNLIAIYQENVLFSVTDAPRFSTSQKRFFLNLHTHTHKVKNTQTSNWVCLTVQFTELLLHEGNGQCRCTWYTLTCLIKTQALKHWCCTFTLIVGYWKAFHTFCLVVVFWHRCKLHENLQFIMADLKLHKIYCSVWSERKSEGKVGWCI